MLYKQLELNGLFRYLPREVDPLVYNMSHEDPGNVSYSEIGGLSEQIRELREVRQCFKSYFLKNYMMKLGVHALKLNVSNEVFF